MRRLAIAPALEPGELGEPGGRPGFEDADRPFGPWCAKKPPDGFEDWQIRLRFAVVLEAGAGRQHHVWIDGRKRQKGVDHRGLADARFAGQEHELTLAVARAREAVLEQ